ncbi:phage tail protein [Xenorhabdus bovienii]|uniref:phage tail protein n=1 Tax=Xenorhabdus bovienii TaxID=40576 RepID=UPI00237C798A|nr:phage tail protein [Xenorhabdus bovienii]MDE1492675.1 phage tail protein [Xenorhabdus bovienii]MDE9487216.1 phage tail protein [Xenorhabdus bovienii]MDE9536311.1 phage tail protein [Xenorhabdus bovienii]MDE9553232.1 phage tail protein [Xenorhabdus bovienii]MDE9556626.1 phage tail protein [Xenorhabdus bovienii]
MNKPRLLRERLTEKINYLRDNPEYLHVFVEDGVVLATMAPALSYEYAYTLNLIIEAYPGDQDILMAVVGHWLREHQPDIFANPDNRRSGFTFDINILNDTTADISIDLKLTERVQITQQGDASTVTALPEPENPFDRW